MDRSGRLVAQAVESLPIHIASMHGLMQALLDKFGDDIHPGDHQDEYRLQIYRVVLALIHAWTRYESAEIRRPGLPVDRNGP